MRYCSLGEDEDNEQINSGTKTEVEAEVNH